MISLVSRATVAPVLVLCTLAAELVWARSLTLGDVLHTYGAVPGPGGPTPSRVGVRCGGVG